MAKQENDPIPLSHIFASYGTENPDGTKSIHLREITTAHLREAFSWLVGKDVAITQENTDGQQQEEYTRILRVEQEGEETVNVYYIGRDGKEWVTPMHALKKGLKITIDAKTAELIDIGLVYNLGENAPEFGSDAKYAVYTVIRDPSSISNTLH